MYRPVFAIPLIFSLLIMSFSASGAEVVDDILDKVKDINKTVNRVENRTTSLQDKLDHLPTTVQGALDINIDPETMDKLKNVVIVAGKAIKDQNEKLAAFGDGSPGDGCAEFRGSLNGLLSNLLVLSDQLASVGDQSLDLTPGDLALIDKIPCEVLFAMSLAFEQTPLEQLVENLSGIATSLSVMMPLMTLSPTALGELEGAPDMATRMNESRDRDSRNERVHIEFIDHDVIHTSVCEAVTTFPTRHTLSTAASLLKALSIRLQYKAAKIDTDKISGMFDLATKTVPKFAEADVGAWGFAHVTLQNQDPAHKLAQGMETKAKIFDGITAFINNKLDTCISSHNQRVIMDQIEIIKAQVCSMSRTKVEGC